MTVKAVFTINDVWVMGGGVTGATVTGKSTDGTVDFTGGTNPMINVGPIDWDQHDVAQQIEDGVKTALTGSPYNMTFASGDEVWLWGRG